MTTRLTIFTATLVQDSALSVSGVDRESTSDQPFTVVDGVPLLSGRGLKGAAVAMARRFFEEPLPRTVSEASTRRTALRRSAWEFANARPATATIPRLRSGVGILHKTGARAQGVLYDREVVARGTEWPLELRVDWRYDPTEAVEAEGILGYVLARHWAEGRCWLGGGVSRGLGWCRIKDLLAYRLDPTAYDKWVESGRRSLPPPQDKIPEVEPTKDWCFRTRDVRLRFGEYVPNDQQPPWGVDMLAVGPHDSEQGLQPPGSGQWARPVWTGEEMPPQTDLPTDRALLMEGSSPLLPGASVRGPMRHAFSRRCNTTGPGVKDPNLVQGAVGEKDEAGRVFGTVKKSSRVLIRDAVAEPGWAAARLHMHAEDEFSAGSFESAKRDAVRVLKGDFQVRIVVEGPNDAAVAELAVQVDRLVALGALGHLPVGGHKTRGAGWGRWKSEDWVNADVFKARTWTAAADAAEETAGRKHLGTSSRSAYREWRERTPLEVCVEVKPGRLDTATPLTLGEAAVHARADLGGELFAWWCEPSVDLDLNAAPHTFGRAWPRHDNVLRVEEAAFFATTAAWRAARTANGWRTVLVREVEKGTVGAETVIRVETPVRLHHDSTRFSAADTGAGLLVIREWRSGDQVVGYTLGEGKK
ncbi:MAG: hypothetical protein HYZ53_09480 [Planctomycetes bacterium]|nr:hypothetical protein [Planctomycetota bacterium]